MFNSLKTWVAVSAWAAVSLTMSAQSQNTANLSLSTSEANPEHVFYLAPSLVQNNGYFLTKDAKPTKAMGNRGTFAFFDGGADGMYYLYNVEHHQWVSPIDVNSPAEGKNKVAYSQNKAEAKPWYIVRETGRNIENRFDILPNKTTNLAWNFYGGPSNDADMRVGLYNKTDGGSSWAMFEMKNEPVSDKVYYIYCNNDSKQYFYNKNNSLAIAATPVDADAYKFLVTKLENGKYVFRNLEGKYLAFDASTTFSLAAESHEWDLQRNAFTDGAYSIYSAAKGRYAVMKTDGGVDKADKTYNPLTTNFSSDIVFDPAPAPAELSAVPRDGNGYFIYCNNDSKQFFYADNGALKVANTQGNTNSYKFFAVKNANGTFSFRNLEGKYLGFVGTKFSLVDVRQELEVRAEAFASGAYSLYSPTAQKYVVMKSDGTIDQATTRYNRESTDFSSDIVFIKTELPVQTLNVAIPIGTGMKVSFDGVMYNASFTVKYLPTFVETAPTVEFTNAAYGLEGFYNGNTKLENGSLIDLLKNATAPVNLTAKVAPIFFSESVERAKWLRVRSSRNSAVTWQATTTGQPYNQNLDVTQEGQLFALVGTPAKFKIYSRAAKAYLKADANSAREVGTSFDGVGSEWKLLDYTTVNSSDAGYRIATTTNDAFVINSFGGARAGAPLKFWDASDGGGSWLFSIADAEVDFAINVSGTNPYAVNTRIADTRLTINGEQSTTNIEQGAASALVSKKMFVATGDKFKFENINLYRGYTFEGFKNGADAIPVGTEVAITPSMKLSVNYAVDTNNKHQYLFYQPRNGVPYRIPSIGVSRDGHIIAVTDHRPSGADVGFGEVDIKFRRSNGAGSTWDGTSWEDEKFLADGNGVGADGNANKYDYAFGDAAMVADRESDEVLVMSVGGKVVCWYGNANKLQHVVRHISKDNGVTWTHSPVTEQFYGKLVGDNVYNVFFGSGRLVQSKYYKAPNSKYYRVYGCLWAEYDNSANPAGTNGQRRNIVAYSDDFGATWKPLGGKDCYAAQGACDEPKVEELPDGTIMLSSREGGSRVFNIFKFADVAAGTGSWGTAKKSNSVDGGLNFGGNSTNGEILLVRNVLKNGERKDILLQSVPTGSGRSNVSLFYKELDKAGKEMTTDDLCKGWTKGMEVSNMSSAYSTMVLQPNGSVAFFYEEAPGGYCMVYREITIAEATNNAYQAGFKGYNVTVNGVAADKGGAVYTGVDYAGSELARGGAQLFSATQPAITTIKAEPVDGMIGKVSVDKTTGNITIDYKNGYDVKFSEKNVMEDKVYGTLCLPVATTIPNGVKAYIGVSVNAETTLLQLEELVGGVLPANTGVVLLANKDQLNKEFSFVATTENPVAPINNLLKGKVVPTTVTANENYVLANKSSQGVALYLYTGTTLPANRAYLPKAQGTGAPVQAFSFSFDGVTSIGAVAAAADSAPAYDLSGRRIVRPMQGVMYIRNGAIRVEK